MSRGFVLLTTLPIVIGLAAADYNSQLRAKDLSDQVPIAELWQPTTISTQDLFAGPWGRNEAPDPAATYRFRRSKQHGVNPGMTVVDPGGREWSVKQAPHDPRGAEGPIEVVLSRVLSAVGYHQPPVYYLPAFTLADTFGTRHEPGGRFRLKHPDLTELRGAWDWKQNPFVGTRPHEGLLVILIMFNSADLKNSNNTLYEHRTASGEMEKWYVVRDLGAALGTTTGIRPKRGDPDQFASLPFITGMNGDHVTFGYSGWRFNVVRDGITPAGVRWACALLAQLTETQWYDAFRAGGYEKPTAERFIRTLRQKIAEGLALPTA